MDGSKKSKSRMLRALINSQDLEFLMEAHNGISAKIAEEAGFSGIWASGLTISASLGVRDNNEASWTQVLEVLEYMSDATDIPILLDGDTGYGNFNNVRRLVKKLEQRGIAGVCLEDKIFPKTNSFIAGEKQPMADIEEFCGKIMAAKDSQEDEAFCVIARTEAFITGWGLKEALKRAQAYAQAGADAILVHSKRSDAKDIKNFMDKWSSDTPVVIVPTKYYTTPTEEFRRMGISLAIWANHLLRGAVKEMHTIAKRLYKEQTLLNIEEEIAPVDELFRLQNAAEYNRAEKKYLPHKMEARAIILAASEGKNFGSLTKNRPKCMLLLGGVPLIQTQEKTLNECSLRDINVVVGYKKEEVQLINNATYINNPDYENSGIIKSLYCAKNLLNGPCLVTYGDILYEPQIIEDLLRDESDIILAVNTSEYVKNSRYRAVDAVVCSDVPSDRYLAKRTTTIEKIWNGKNVDMANGELMGIMKLSSKGARIVSDFMERLKAEQEPAFNKMGMKMFLELMMKNGIEIKGRYFRGHWLNVNSIEDLAEEVKIMSKGAEYIEEPTI